MTDDWHDPYFLPDVPVLRNRLGLRDAAKLDRKERLLVSQRIRAGVPEGRFNLAHLQDIHRHLFQDVYDWAGELRTVEIAKGGNHFLFMRSIATGMADVHNRLIGADFLRGLSADAFADQAGRIIGDINFIHPFREGNGRTQLQYLKQLAAQAGHDLDLSLLNTQAGRWIEASIAAHGTVYEPMAEMIRDAIRPDRE